MLAVNQKTRHRNRDAYHLTHKRVSPQPLAHQKNIVKGESVMVLSPHLSKKIGKSAALFLQQLHYWLVRGQGVEVNGRTYIYNSYEGWYENLNGLLSISTIRRAIKLLTQHQLIEVAQFGGCHRINYYHLNYAMLKQITCQKGEGDLLNNEPLQSFKMSSPCVQNERMYNKETKNTNLNSTTSNCNRAKFEEVFDHTPSSLSEQPLIPQQMLGIWNEIIGKLTHTASITQKRASYLTQALQDKFNNDLQAWHDFCHRVATSDFLMGRLPNTSFRLTLDWLLKFSNLQKVLEGNYQTSTVDDSSPAQDHIKPLSLEEYHQHIDQNAADRFDQQCHKLLITKLEGEGGLARYHNSFYRTPVRFNHQGEGRVICHIDGYIPVYEEVYHADFKRIFNTLLGDSIKSNSTSLTIHYEKF